MYVEKLNIDTLLLPYMHPYGPVLFEYEYLDKRIISKKYALSIRDHYVSSMSVFAKNYGVNIVIPGIIEKAGPYKYVSTLFIPSTYGAEIAKYRKTILSEHEKKLGLTRGSKPVVFKINDDIGFSSLLDREVFYPELARIYSVNSSFIVVGIPQNEPVKDYLYILKSISKINKIMVVVPGSRVYSSSKLYYVFPTIIINENGEVVYRYNEEEQALIRIPMEKFIKDNNFDENIVLLINMMNKYLNKSRKRK